MTDELADEIVAGDRDEVALAHVAETFEDLRHPFGVEPDPLAQPIDQQQRRNLANAALHGRKTDQLAVELLDDRADVRLGVGRRDVERLGLRGFAVHVE